MVKHWYATGSIRHTTYYTQPQLDNFIKPVRTRKQEDEEVGELCMSNKTKK